MIKYLQNKGIKGLPLIILLVLAITMKANAADQVAASCSAADIQAAIDATVSTGGGTTTIPACDKDNAPFDNGALWKNGDQICIAGDVELRVLGSGQDTTDIGYADGAKADYSYSCPGGYPGLGQDYPVTIQGRGLKEFGQLTISGASDIGSPGLYIRACTDRTCDSGLTNVRFHHFGIKNIGPNQRGLYFCQNWQSTALIDHAYIGDQVSSGAYGISINGGWEERAFEVPPVLGTDNGLFIEDSEFNGNYHPIAAFYAARLHARHNTFANNTSGSEGHGSGFTSGCGYGDPVEKNGSYRYEIYDNEFLSGAYAFLIRSGFWMITDNIFHDEISASFFMSTAPEAGSVGATEGSSRASCAVAQGCQWASSGYTTTESCHQSPQGVYIWNNQFEYNNTLYSTPQGGDDLVGGNQRSWCVRENNEYFLRAPQVGDPYWFEGINGSSYTKYTYPHPLQSGGDTVAPSPAEHLE